MIKGIAVSEGIVVGKVFKKDEISLNVKRKKVLDVQKEIERFDCAIKQSVEQIKKLRDIALEKFGTDKAEIFESHLLVIQDPELRDKVISMIEDERVSAEYAILKVRNEFLDIFESLTENIYMQERAYDIKDTTNRVISYLTNQKYADLLDLKEEIVLIANDLSPSETVLLNKKFVKAIVTNIGGKTSHAAIITRSLDIPCLVGTKNITKQAKDNDIVIVDAVEGHLFINPNQDLLNEYEEKILGYKEHIEIVKKFKDKETVTKDGKQIKIFANIEGTKDLEKVNSFGAEGIGLFRTEFLYMEKNNLPTEEEQYLVYKEVLSSTTNTVIIRTLDIGGDKQLSYFKFNEEINPALGQRAIRMCIANQDIFKVQLRALLRASVHGKLKIMIPMISLVEEFLEVKEIIKNIEVELTNENINFNNYELGMTVEVPSAAILANHFAKHVDFFSIGTNDLIQYTFAADRLNESVSRYYQPLNPSILYLIKNVIDCAHKENKVVGMCGEAASDINVIPILLGFGLDEFSMSPSLIPSTRFLISKMDKKELSKLSEQFLHCENSEQVLGLIEEKFK